MADLMWVAFAFLAGIAVAALLAVVLAVAGRWFERRQDEYDRAEIELSDEL